MRNAIWTAAAALLVTSVAGAQRPVLVDGWSSEVHPAERFAADSTACVAVAAEIAMVTEKPLAPEFARCIGNREWIPVRRPVPAPSCIPLALRLIGAASLPDSGKRGIALLNEFARAASNTLPELEVFQWKDETVVGSIHRYGWIDFSRDGLGWEKVAFLQRLIGTGRGRPGEGWEQFTDVPVVVSFRPSCFRAYQAPRGWREPPTPRRIPVDVGSNQTYFEFQVEKKVQVIPETQQVDFPVALRGRGIGGEVVAQFVVDTLGRIEIGSFKVLRVTGDELFVAAVRAHVPRMRFYPAEIEGRKVRQLVQQSFVFNISP